MRPPHWLRCRWSKWEPYTAEFTERAYVAMGVTFTHPEPLDLSEERERRRCETCGATQDRGIGS